MNRPYRPVMRRSRISRTAIVLAITGVVTATVIGGLLTFGGDQTAHKTGSAPSALVLSSAYAKSVDYPKTVQVPSKRAVTNEKGCSSSIEAVYADAAGKTGLISDLLRCNSQTAAARVLATFRKSVRVDTSVRVPSQLGASAFATASSAPEYIVAWQVGSDVALAAIDVDIAASSSSSESSSGSVTSKSITQDQVKVLTAAAVQQDTLYH